MEKNSYERSAYESVDDGSPSWVSYIPKMNGKQNSGIKGLKEQQVLEEQFDDVTEANE